DRLHALLHRARQLQHVAIPRVVHNEDLHDPPPSNPGFPPNAAHPSAPARISMLSHRRRGMQESLDGNFFLTPAISADTVTIYRAPLSRRGWSPRRRSGGRKKGVLNMHTLQRLVRSGVCQACGIIMLLAL